jgi:hypothetical protein
MKATDFTGDTDNRKEFATEGSEVTEVGEFVAHLISVASVAQSI